MADVDFQTEQELNIFTDARHDEVSIETGGDDDVVVEFEIRVTDEHRRDVAAAAARKKSRHDKSKSGYGFRRRTRSVRYAESDEEDKWDEQKEMPRKKKRTKSIPKRNANKNLSSNGEYKPKRKLERNCSSGSSTDSDCTQASRPIRLGPPQKSITGPHKLTSEEALKLTKREARLLMSRIRRKETSVKIPEDPKILFYPWQLDPSPQPPPADTDRSQHLLRPPLPPTHQRSLRVLSLFDGISAGLAAIKGLGFEVEIYYAAEIDSQAVKVARKNHPEIIHVGNVSSITENDLRNWGPFNLVIGGSPCNDFSLVNKFRQGFTGKTGRLFFDFARIYRICSSINEEANLLADTHCFFLFENTVMDLAEQEVISYALECEPVSIDALYLTPAKRRRLYWTNIPGAGRPLDISVEPRRLTLQQVLMPGRVALCRKIQTITTQWCSQLQGKFLQHPVRFLGAPSRLWMVELERCFDFPDHYTDADNLVADERLRLLGMSWSLPVIRHLFAPLEDWFKRK